MAAADNLRKTGDFMTSFGIQIFGLLPLCFFLLINTPFECPARPGIDRALRQDHCEQWQANFIFMALENGHGCPYICLYRMIDSNFGLKIFHN